jgi:ribosomal protein S18 acetylase RimI-like enzyme
MTDCFLQSMQESITACRGRWDEERERAQFQRQLDLPSAQIIRVAEEDVGFVVLFEQPPVVQMHTLCVAPEWQNQGIGSRVTRDAIHLAAQTGRDLVLWVLKVNVRAEALYRRLGFVVIEESEHHHHMKYIEARPATG